MTNEKKELQELSDRLYHYWKQLEIGSPEWFDTARELQKVDARLNNHEVPVA